jgi:formate-dependent nitrite reductase membrane component NrfD
MANEFNMRLTSQREWSWLLAIDLFLGGLGGGLFLLYRVLFLPPWIGLLSLILVLAGGMVLLSELGHPLRAWRAILRPQTSWISRGVLCIALFVFTAVLSLAPAFPALSSSVPWTANGQLAEISGWIASLCALFITLYPGFVLGASPSIPFWDTPLLPLIFFTQALLGASGVLLLVSGSLAGRLSQIHSLAAILIAVNFVVALVYLLAMSRSGASEKEAVRRLKRGGLGWMFGAGAVLVGMLFPLLLVNLSSSAIFAGCCILSGAFLFRYCILIAGVYVPSALVGLDMSRFKGNRSSFAMEYADWTVSGRGNSPPK